MFDKPRAASPEDELRAEIAAHAAAGREAEREAAADRLAAAIMRRTLPRRDER
jgi:hypothetical protein